MSREFWQSGIPNVPVESYLKMPSITDNSVDVYTIDVRESSYIFLSLLFPVNRTGIPFSIDSNHRNVKHVNLLTPKDGKIPIRDACQEPGNCSFQSNEIELSFFNIAYDPRHVDKHESQQYPKTVSDEFYEEQTTPTRKQYKNAHFTFLGMEGILVDSDAFIDFTYILNAYMCKTEPVRPDGVVSLGMHNFSSILHKYRNLKLLTN